MTRGAVIFILLIPALIALGHDAYLFYINHMQVEGLTIDGLLENFKFSAIGFILTTYSEGTYKELVRTTEPDIWPYVDEILTIPAFYAGLAFAGAITVILFLFGLFKIGPFSPTENFGYKEDASISSIRAGSQSKKMNYKRK